jgi:hypothetical protein
MEITISQDDGRVPVTVFHLQGDLADEEPLWSQAQQAYVDGTRYLLLDMRKVPSITSAGLRAIHEVYQLLRSDAPEESDEVVRKGIASGSYTSGHLKLLKPSKTAMKSLSVAGYDMFVDIYKKYAEAIASF